MRQQFSCDWTLNHSIWKGPRSFVIFKLSRGGHHGSLRPRARSDRVRTGRSARGLPSTLISKFPFEALVSDRTWLLEMITKKGLPQ